MKWKYLKKKMITANNPMLINFSLVINLCLNLIIKWIFQRKSCLTTFLGHSVFLNLFFRFFVFLYFRSELLNNELTLLFNDYQKSQVLGWHRLTSQPGVTGVIAWRKYDWQSSKLSEIDSVLGRVTVSADVRWSVGRSISTHSERRAVFLMLRTKI